MFRKANRVSRPDKALILGFMAGMRENPRPNSENVIVIKLGETEVRRKIILTNQEILTSVIMSSYLMKHLFRRGENSHRTSN